MRQLTLIFIITLIGTPILAKGKDSIQMRLNYVMANKNVYIEEKEQRILHLKQLLSVKDLSLEQSYDINMKLYKEYKKFQSDSAVSYILKNRENARQMNNVKLQYESDLQLAWLYSTKGMYIESKDLLEKIDKNKLHEDLLPEYYLTYCDFYSHYAQSNNQASYYQISSLYRDSLLSVLPPTSLKYQIEYATKKMYQLEENEVKEMFLSLLEKTTDKDADRAVIAYLLGYTYKEQKNTEAQKKYYSISAIADIENCIKDNASFQNLALTYYEMGDIDLAYKFIQSAIDDAIFCNVRYRTMENSGFYPIINSSYQEKERKQKKELQVYLLLISILSVCLIIGVVYTYKQMKRISQIRKKLYYTNLELGKLNDNLTNTNDNLKEANHVKEEYIAHFFDLCSQYIDKLEEYRKTLNSKAKNNQIDELFKILKSNTIIENELAVLYDNFDSIFLNLYPTFIEEFNALLLPEELIQPKQGELLNTELRIFALIRLGITDSVKIASFLRYSLRTVYNYRTKVRNKAAVSRDEFEEYVKKIGVSYYKNK